MRAAHRGLQEKGGRPYEAHHSVVDGSRTDGGTVRGQTPRLEGPVERMKLTEKYLNT